MPEVKGLKIAIGASVEDFKSGLADVKSSLGGLGDFASSALGLLTNPIALATAAVVGIGAAAFSVGKDFEQAFGTIRVGTGATGAQLESLKGSFKTVFADAPGDAQAVANAIADLNTRTGATGPMLETLAGQYLKLAKITGEDVQSAIEGGSEAFNAWGVETDAQAGKLDFLFKTSQALGPSVSEITSLVTQQAPALKELGLNFEQSAVLAGKLQAETGNASAVLSSLSRGLREAAEEGSGAREHLDNVVNSIKNAKDPAEAAKVAFDNFGRQGVAMADAIKEGRFEVDELVASLAANTETISAAEEESRTFQDRLDLVWKSVQTLLAPIGELLVGALNAVLDLFIALSPAIDFVASALGKVVDFIRGAVTFVFRSFIDLMDQQIKVLEKIPIVGPKVAGALKSVRDGLDNAIKPTKDFTAETDKADAAMQKVGAPSSGSAPRVATAVRDVGAAHDEAAPKVQRYTDAQNDAVDAANRALAGELALESQTDALADAFRDAGPPAIALKGNFSDVDTSVLDVTTSMANADVAGSLEQWKTDADAKLPAVKGAFTEWGEGVSSIVGSLSTGLTTKLFTDPGSFGAEALGKLKTIGQSFLDVFDTKMFGPEGVITKFINQGLGALTTALDGLISKITGGVGGALSSVFGAGTNAATNTATTVAGTATTTATSAGGTAASAAGGAFSTFLGVAGLGVAIADAVIGGMQRAKMNDRLFQIAENTDRTARQLGSGREDQGVLGALFRILEQLEFGNLVKATEDFRNKWFDFGLPVFRALETQGAFVQPTLDHFGSAYFGPWSDKFDAIERNTAATERAVRDLQGRTANNSMQISQLKTAIERNQEGIRTTIQGSIPRNR